ncbi:MAG: ATP-dependent helicase [Candidatus Marinimicrobia bacterium]|jgi:DNA helicase-2/ATP-dependent DNA helicase PcrA|nr:ATP-dependent helicase [Candidatus Neomarinimicrobiota bacterium]|tara:strand:+ start:1484 stop:3649 length:2166 start_codon:yes stop_codon:yes gene_type:complete
MKLQDLNTQQLKAVQTVNKPVLVFAGAGSGKTRVLTYKVWHLIKENLFKPNEILALTFTNKAAAEMKVRIQESISCDGVNVGTFHSIGARMLRMHIASLNDNYNSSFTIYDTVDQKSVIKEVIENLNLSEFKELNIGFLKMQIDKFKNANLSIKDIESKAQTFEDEKIAEVYKAYCDTLKSNNALDFNDLLLLPIRLLKENKKILDYYQNSWKYVLVDEFQDTNSPQFEIVSLLAGKHQNITVVGDDDQSIYGWRGANIDNILTNFQDVFAKNIEIKLEKNYRSTQRILDGAWSVVSNNKNRAEKKLVATKGKGEKISLISTGSDEEESNAICDSIKSEIKLNKNTFKDFAVLYRTNAQSRSIEQAMVKEGLPYNIVGGTKFYDRKEIKDVLAYLKLVANTSDDIALKRIINFPVRGIGEKSIKMFIELAAKNKSSLFDSLEKCREIKLRGKQQDSIENFHASITKFSNLLETLDPKELLRTLLEEFNIENYYKNNPAEQDRYNNIQELKASVDKFSDQTGGNLKDFLQEISLFTDIDDWDDKENSITLMTVHAAKGLEFSTVFVAGLEQGLFPLVRIDDGPDQMEEERRLFYVAVTRAMNQVYLLNAKYRRRFGAMNTTSFVQSDFLDEIDENVIKVKAYKSVYTRRVVGTGSKKKIQISRTVTEFDDFKIGDQVQHNLFGVGTILVLSGTGENQKVGVEFDGGLRKKLIVKYARLKKID